MKYIYQGKQVIIDGVESEEFQDIKNNIRRDIISKYIDANNLNFLVGTGASRYAGAVAINKTTEERNYKKILNDFESSDTERKIREKVKSYSSLRIEEILDKLFTLKRFLDEVDPNSNSKKNIDTLIDNLQESFIKECVLNINYSVNHLHKVFLKKILSRKSSLNKTNIFTLNYDMLFEHSAEEMNILVNNGFIGFQNRSFYPASFKVDSYLKVKSNEQRFNKTFNLYKLHGSLSWEFNKYSAPYGITEKQILLNEERHLDYSTLSDDLIIYPVQNKKKQSLDLPYSELFRQFAEALNLNQSVLVVMGYSFLDEHVNDIISNALSNPDFNILIFTYENIDTVDKDTYLYNIWERAMYDNRITIFSGSYFGDFETISTQLMPYVDEFDPVKESYNTFLKLKGEKNE